MSAGFELDLSDDNTTTYDVPFHFDADGNADAYITIVGKNSQQYKDAERTTTRVALKKSSVRGRPLDMKKDSDAEEFMDQRESTNVALAAAVTVGWFGLTDKGAEYLYSPANAKSLYVKHAVVREKVLAALKDQANFLTR